MKNQATINLGTLGHVSHGKSTLVEALSGIKPMKHEAELGRNLTIKLGYANFKVYRCNTCPKPICYQSWQSSILQEPVCAQCSGEMTLLRHFSLVDCPGHDALMATMLNGAAVMDSAMLMVAANAEVPQPQTAEHLAAAEIMHLKNLITVQSKLDLVTEPEAHNNYKSILHFVKGNTHSTLLLIHLDTVAQDAPIIPISCRPWQHCNLDVLLQYLVEKLPVPTRNLSVPALMQVVRSFDVNSPGGSALDLKGGVAGGTLRRGVLRIGQPIEIRPGIVRKNAEGAFSCTPIITTVKSLFSERTSLQYAVPGGLIAVGSTIDPTLTKQDRLVGQIIGEIGKLPEVYINIVIETTLMPRLVGEGARLKVKKLEKKEILMLNVGSTSTTAEVIAVKGKYAKMKLNRPCCAELEEMVSVSRHVNSAWRLIGYAHIKEGEALVLGEPAKN
jgi:translation initiation factor 2 subunit 3